MSLKLQDNDIPLADADEDNIIDDENTNNMRTGKVLMKNNRTQPKFHMNS